jgi:hypothetical protein
LQEHNKPVTRGLHYAGSALVLAILAFGFAVDLRLLWAIPLVGYGFAWAAHFFVEHNKPATLTYPLWSLISDFRMFGLWVAGRLTPHLEKAGVEL